MCQCTRTHTHAHIHIHMQTCVHIVYVNWMPSVIEIKSLSTNIHTYNNIVTFIKQKQKANKPKRNLYIT